MSGRWKSWKDCDGAVMSSRTERTPQFPELLWMYNPRMKTRLAVLFILVWSLPMLAQCGFVAEPVAIYDWHRSEGWQLPGVEGYRAYRLEYKINGKSPAWPDGVTVSTIEHSKSYRVSFPEAIFQENGTPKKMRARAIGLHTLLRWEINGKPYAYSYELWPDDVLCTFSVDLVDDKGDGVFRLMTAPGHAVFTSKLRPPPLPEWALKPKS